VPVTPIGAGFFPIVSSEVAARNRKRRKIIQKNRLRGRVAGACFFLLLSFV
jgi:UDP-galactopyranose mutase